MMPRISPKRRAAFDILDWLFFNQTWLLRLSEDDGTLDEDSPRAGELIILYEIMRRVNEEVASIGATGIAAQALKNTVYCILEASFYDDLVQKSLIGYADHLSLVNERGVPLSNLAEAIDPAQAASFHEYEQQYFVGLIAAIGEKAHGVSMHAALTIAATVKAAFGDAPAAVTYRLTERVVLLEFMDAPVKFLSWMYRVGILTSKKFVAGRATRDIAEDFKARVGLLCEFMLLRDYAARLTMQNSARHEGIRRLQVELDDKLTDAAWFQLHEENNFYMRRGRRHKAHPPGMLTFDLSRLADEAYLHGFLERFAENHWRSRFWTGPQQSWTGVVGAGMILAYHSLVDSQSKITRNGNNYSKTCGPVVQEVTVAQRVCQNLNEHGLECRPASLYETYVECYMKQPAGLYHRATIYHKVQQQLGVVFPAQGHDVVYLGVIATSSP